MQGAFVDSSYTSAVPILIWNKLICLLNEFIRNRIIKTTSKIVGEHLFISVPVAWMFQNSSNVLTVSYFSISIQLESLRFKVMARTGDSESNFSFRTPVN